MRSRALLVAVAAAAVVGLVIFGLWLLPTPRSSPADQCAGSVAPAACRAVVRGGGARDLGGLRPLPDLTPPPDLSARPLAVGLAALDSRWLATAYRLCGDAVQEEGTERATAYMCQGRAALGLGWPSRAAYLAARSLELQDDAAGHVLAGDALEALHDVRAARLEFLRALDVEPRNAAAAAGLRRCGGTPPPDLSEERGERDSEEDDHAIT